MDNLIEQPSDEIFMREALRLAGCRTAVDTRGLAVVSGANRL